LKPLHPGQQLEFKPQLCRCKSSCTLRHEADGNVSLCRQCDCPYRSAPRQNCSMLHFSAKCQTSARWRFWFDTGYVESKLIHSLSNFRLPFHFPYLEHMWASSGSGAALPAEAGLASRLAQWFDFRSSWGLY